MPLLHQRGVDLLLNIQTAREVVEKLTQKDIHNLLREAEVVLQKLLERDLPSRSDDSG